MATVALENVSKVYPNGVRALTNVSLEVPDGQFVVLVGPSGSGKTTLLRLLAGLEAPTTGTIRFGGQVMNAVPPARRGVAFVFQRPALYPHLRVRDNLAFGLRLTGGCSTTERERRVGEIAELLGLAGVLDRRPDELSGGQQQRVALGRALVRRPAVILLDEPLSNLDGPLRTQLRRELHLLQRRFATTMVYVTHDQVEALTLADRLIVLHEGGIQQADLPLRVYQQPSNRFVAGWLGGMNILEGRLLADDAGWYLAESGGILRLPGDLPIEWKELRGRAVVLGVLAEDVTLGPTPANSPAMVRFRGTITAVELLGAGALVTGRQDGWQLTALVSSGAEIPEFGSQREFGFTLNRVHWFDAFSGRALPG